MDVGITYEAMSEYVALDLSEDSRLSSEAVLLGSTYNISKGKHVLPMPLVGREEPRVKHLELPSRGGGQNRTSDTYVRIRTVLGMS